MLMVPIAMTVSMVVSVIMIMAVRGAVGVGVRVRMGVCLRSAMVMGMGMHTAIGMHMAVGMLAIFNLHFTCCAATDRTHALSPVSFDISEGIAYSIPISLTRISVPPVACT